MVADESMLLQFMSRSKKFKSNSVKDDFKLVKVSKEKDKISHVHVDSAGG